MSAKHTTHHTPTAVFGEVIGFVISILIMIYLVPLLPFVLESYQVWLPVGIFTTLISTVFKIGKHLSGFNTLKYLFEIAHLIPSIYSTVVLIDIYPFDFARVGFPVMDAIFPFALYVAIFGMFVAIIVNFVKVFIPNFEDHIAREEKEKDEKTKY